MYKPGAKTKLVFIKEERPVRLQTSMHIVLNQRGSCDEVHEVTF